jgi:hypothetical protein
MILELQKIAPEVFVEWDPQNIDFDDTSLDQNMMIDDIEAMTNDMDSVEVNQ